MEVIARVLEGVGGVFAEGDEFGSEGGGAGGEALDEVQPLRPGLGAVGMGREGGEEEREHALNRLEGDAYTYERNS